MNLLSFLLKFKILGFQKKMFFQNHPYIQLFDTNSKDIRPYLVLMYGAVELLSRTISDNRLIVNRTNNPIIKDYFSKHESDEIELLELARKDLLMLQKLNPEIARIDCSAILPPLELIVHYAQFARAYLPIACAFADGMALKVLIIDNMDRILAFCKSNQLDECTLVFTEMKKTELAEYHAAKKVLNTLLTDPNQRFWFYECMKVQYHLYELLCQGFYSASTQKSLQQD